MTTVSHVSWVVFVHELSKATGFGKVTYREAGQYVQLGSFKHDEIVALKRFALDNQLPVLCRKWVRVDETIKADRHLKAQVLKDLIGQGLTTSEIAVECGCTRSAVSNARKRLREDL